MKGNDKILAEILWKNYALFLLVKTSSLLCKVLSRMNEMIDDLLSGKTNEKDDEDTEDWKEWKEYKRAHGIKDDEGKTPPQPSPKGREEDKDNEKQLLFERRNKTY